VRLITLSLVGSATLVGRLWAQAPGMPVVNAGIPRGFTVGLAAGFPNDAAGAGTGFQASLALGARRAGVAGFVSRIDNPYVQGRTLYSGGANVALKVLGGPLVPVAVNLQAGAAYWAASSGLGAGTGYDDKLKAWHVPVGLGISWTIPRPVVALKPWIAPRLDYTHIDAPAGSLALLEGSQTDFGLSGGLSFGFLNGLAVDLAVDRVFRGGIAQKPTTLGAGLSFTFK
jgi:hypothetical protein